MYADDDLLALSGIQHFAFCRRQWALIHLEQVWAENVLTVEGDLVHRRAHDDTLRERRGNTLVVRGLAVRSWTLGLSGVCDVVEFHVDDQGIPLSGEEGLWLPAPVEYKRGRRKTSDADRLQLCAQALCLEEMFACNLSTGYLYYDETKSRERVSLDAELRGTLISLTEEMHKMYVRRHTPKVKPFSACRSCSLLEVCVPRAVSRETVADYMTSSLSGESQ